MTRRLLLALTLAVLTVGVYAPVRHHGFINLDDAQYVSGNPVVQAGVTWDGVRWAFTTGHAGNWHPLTWLSHMLDVQLFGPAPGPGHLVNVLLHATSATLLFALLAALTGSLVRSAVVAAIFALHPLRVESVAWIAERKDVLCTVLSLLTLRLYVGYVRVPGAWRYAAVAAGFGAALLAKPMAVTLPFVMLLLDVWPLRRGVQLNGSAPASSASWRVLVAEKLPLFGMVLVSSIVTFLVQQQAGAVQSADAFPWVSRIANALVAYVVYVRQTFWPMGLAPLYPYASQSGWLGALAAALALAIVTLLTLRQLARRPYLAIGWLWYLGMLVPVIGLVQVGSQPHADRYSYLPQVGLILAVVWAVGDVAHRSRGRRLLLGALALGAIAGAAALTRAQIVVWQDAVSLWDHTARVTPDNARAHAYLGQALTTAGRPDDAVRELEIAVRLRPDLAESHNYLGLALVERGETGRAIAEFRDAVRLRPHFVEAWNNLGLALAQAGRLDEAVGAFREAVRVDSGFAPAFTNLGIAFAQQGRLEDAVRAFREATRLQPDVVEAHVNLGTALTDVGRTAEAIGHFDKALRLDPSSAAAHLGWGRALVQDNRFEAGLQRYQTALRVDPALASSPSFHFDLALAFAGQGRRDDAVRELEAVLRLDPLHAPARDLLSRLR